VPHETAAQSKKDGRLECLRKALRIQSVHEFEDLDGPKIPTQQLTNTLSRKAMVIEEKLGKNEGILTKPEELGRFSIRL
jgi:hypothetical protein